MFYWRFNRGNNVAGDSSSTTFFVIFGLLWWWGVTIKMYLAFVFGFRTFLVHWLVVNIYMPYIYYCLIEYFSEHKTDPFTICDWFLIVSSYFKRGEMRITIYTKMFLYDWFALMIGNILSFQSTYFQTRLSYVQKIYYFLCLNF